MKTLETERLILRKYTEDDFDAVHSYASCAENIVYMMWGPNSEEQTRDFINNAKQDLDESASPRDYIIAVTLKSSGILIGGCDLFVKDDEGSVGWILHRDYWKQGYGTEMGKELLRFGFEELNLHKIVASCDAENAGSYRLMEKIGMRREGLFIEGRPANKKSDKKYGDELRYAILKDEWKMQKDIAYYKI